uniref:COMM domain-containing protein 3 n=1 Tax=Petromyzon marinus TaxID=7757 RepID=S4R8N2_PETMA
MELSGSARLGVELSADPGLMDAAAFRAVVRDAYAALGDKETGGSRSVEESSGGAAVNAATLKLCHSGLLALALEAARHGLDPARLGLGHAPRTLVDVTWRLDYHIKNSNLQKVDEPYYQITLHTEVGCEASLCPVTFTCNREQLQDLLGKLKDAAKSLEKAAQV